MRGFSYVVARDHGFAPNPFNGFCTLATCKPPIRKDAEIGDWVIGTGSAKRGTVGRLVFAMQICEKMTFNDYWSDPRFATRRPVMNGSLKKMYGDNIYQHSNGSWKQMDSHHSHDDGTPNEHNLERDTSVDSVLFANTFYYFGGSTIDVPEDLVQRIVKRGPGYRCFEESDIKMLVTTVLNDYEVGYQDDPAQFSSFQRYDGRS